MAISINLGSGAGSTNGDTLYDAFTKINTMFSTTTKLTSGDLEINGITVGKGNNANFGSTALGYLALNSNSATGNDNTAIGWSALSLNTSGDNNTAFGSNSLKNSTTSNGNTAVGFSSLQDNTTGFENTAVGMHSLLDNISGNSNTALGSLSLSLNQTGINNTGLGVGALYSSISRSNNTAIGKDALSSNTLYSNCTGLGANASFLNGDNQVQLGDSATTTYVYNTVQSRSDLRDKTEIRNTVLGLDFINELRPVDYKWDMREDYRPEKPIDLELDATEEEKDAHKIIMDEWLESCKVENLNHDGTHTRTRYHHGLIAQEVQDIIEASGVDFGGFQDHKVNGGGDVLSIGYDELIAPMIKAIQELTARINVLEGN